MSRVDHTCKQSSLPNYVRIVGRNARYAAFIDAFKSEPYSKRETTGGFDTRYEWPESFIYKKKVSPRNILQAVYAYFTP